MAADLLRLQVAAAAADASARAAAAADARPLRTARLRWRTCRAPGATPTREPGRLDAARALVRAPAQVRRRAEPEGWAGGAVCGCECRAGRRT